MGKSPADERKLKILIISYRKVKKIVVAVMGERGYGLACSKQRCEGWNFIIIFSAMLDRLKKKQTSALKKRANYFSF